MFHSYLDICQAFETCPGHPLLPLGVVNKKDDDHQSCGPVISKNEGKHVRLEFLRILSFYLWWIETYIAISQVKPPNSFYTQNFCTSDILHEHYSDKILYFSIFSPGICNLKNTFGGPLIRVMVSGSLYKKI